MIAPELADILVCPACKGLVAQDVPAQALVCRSCQLAFPVRNHGGKMLPVMLVEEASPIADATDAADAADAGNQASNEG